MPSGGFLYPVARNTILPLTEFQCKLNSASSKVVSTTITKMTSLSISIIRASPSIVIPIWPNLSEEINETLVMASIVTVHHYNADADTLKDSNPNSIFVSRLQTLKMPT